MSSVPDSVRVCPNCGAPAEAYDYCPGCGAHLATLPELPTRTEWEAQRAVATAPLALVEARASTPPLSGPASIRPLLHPTERSRLIIAAVGVALGLLVAVLALIGAGNANFLVQVVGSLALATVLIWFTQQIRRARLLGRSVKVGPDTMPELQALLDEVRATLQYDRRVDVYVVDKESKPISMSSYLGTRIIVIEGGLVAELLAPERRPQLVFLIGRSIGALKAKHARLDLFVALLQAINAVRYMTPLLLPWYRATTYSGDQIGMVCCGDLAAALEATRRLLVGKELASDLGAGAVLPQAHLVQRRLLPRFAQLFSAEPHNTNRYANLLCFGRYHDPESWERVRKSMDAERTCSSEELWARSPYRKRLAGFAA